MEKKIRFGDLVRDCGRPEIVTLWTSPNQDRSFMKAVKQNRVLTVHQLRHNKKDFGQIGFHQRDDALYLVFPRPLNKGRQEPVIGINYELIAQPPVAEPASAKPRAQPKKEPKKTINRNFKVTVR